MRKRRQRGLQRKKRTSVILYTSDDEIQEFREALIRHAYVATDEVDEALAEEDEARTERECRRNATTL